MNTTTKESLGTKVERIWLQFLINKKSKLENKIQRNSKAKPWVIIPVFAGSIFICTISNVLGGLCFCGAVLYAGNKLILPVIRKTKLKLIERYIDKPIETVDNVKKKSKKKLFNFTLGRKKAKEKEKDCASTVKGKLTNLSQTARKTISNLRLFSIDKLKQKMTVKRDVLGHKMVNGEYKLKKSKIIQDYINLYEIRSMRQQAEKEKTKSLVKL